LVSEQVIDVFDAAGIKKPDISILSEEFLLELKGMEHKNVAHPSPVHAVWQWQKL
jgi:type I restriction enzyme R subunit